jgi:hypothetical protein
MKNELLGEAIVNGPSDVFCTIRTEKLKDRREMGLKPTFSCSMKRYGMA